MRRVVFALLITLLMAQPAYAQREAPLPDCPDINPADGSCLPPPPPRPAIDASPAIFTVTTTADELDGSCTTSSEAVLSGGAGLSLREAICLANRTTDLDTIVLSEAIHSLSLANATGPESDNLTGDLDVRQPIVLEGNGATISQSVGDRVLHLLDASEGSIVRDLTLRGGDITGAAGGLLVDNGGTATAEGLTITFNDAFASGGGVGVFASSTLTLRDSYVHANTAGNSGGGVYLSSGSVTVEGSTIANNNATDGGGIATNTSAVTSTVTRSTISANVVTGSGGGVLANGGSTTLTGVTLVLNEATSGGGYDIFSGTLELNETIVAGNLPLNDQCDTTATLDDHNLVQGGGGCSTLGTTDVISGQLVGSIIDTTLRDNGGPTRTHALVPGSDALNVWACTATTDQRGIPRPQGGTCDIGAVERYNGTETFTVTSTADAPDADLGDLVCDDGSGACTLRAAFQQAEEFAQRDTIILGAGATYTPTGETFILQTPIDVRGENATIDASGLTGNDLFRLVESAEIAIDGVTLRGASDDAVEVNDQARLWLLNSVLTGNGTGYQTRLTSTSASVLVNVTITGNTFYGLAAPTDVTLHNSIVWGNGTTDIFAPDLGSVSVEASNVGTGLQAGIDDGGNTSLTPYFANATIGDYRLLPLSPLVDAADASLLPLDYTDRDEDNNTIDQAPFDITGAARVQGGGPDLGAHELNPDPFSDVPAKLPAAFMEEWVETFYMLGITTGCGDGSTYCPDEPVTRGAMAVFILRALNYPNLPHNPTGEAGQVFTDVPNPLQPPSWEDWIEEFYTLGITVGCQQAPLAYCPDEPVTRAAMAVFILRAFDTLPDPDDLP